MTSFPASRCSRAASLCLLVALAATLFIGIPPGHRVSAAPSRAGLPPGFSTRKVIGGLQLPTAIAFSPDRRVFVAEKRGIVKVYRNLRDDSPTVFADLRTKVYNAYDRGLLGLTLHPDFPTTPYVYVLYSLDDDDLGDEVPAPRWGEEDGEFDPCPDPPGRSTHGCVVHGRVSRLEASGNTMIDEKPLVNGWCQQFSSHSVGDLGFGPEGSLYASGGDGASYLFADYGQRGIPRNPCGDPPGGVGANLQPPTAEGGALRSQDLRTGGDPAGLNGSLIRIDPMTGEAFAGNPIVSPNENAERIVAYGMRNPFRFAVRPGTDEVYIGDTGWNRFDEIALAADGSDAVVENFGWPCYEGPRKEVIYETTTLDICTDLYGEPDAVTPAYASYKHDVELDGMEGCRPGGGALSGLTFYDGGLYPDRFDGALFMADYTRHCMWVLYPGEDGRPDPSRVHRFSLLEKIVDLETGPRGDLFYVDITGTVWRIVYTPGNQPPTARIAASPRYGDTPLEVRFSARRSSDPDGDDLTYAWDLDWDGSFDDSRRARPLKVFRNPGVRKVGLKVGDGRGTFGLDAIEVYPGNQPPRIVIDAPRRWRVGREAVFTASGRDPEDGRLPSAAFKWKVGISHCSTRSECHLHPLEEVEGTDEIRFTPPDHDYPAFLEVKVRAKDKQGLSARRVLELKPRTATLRLGSDPAGVRLAAGTSARRTPFSLTALVGSRVVLVAPLVHERDGADYRFSSWSSGRPRTHSVRVRRDSSYRAIYTRN